MFCLPTQAYKQVLSVSAGVNRKQMGEGMAAMAVKAAAPRWMSVIFVVVGADVSVCLNRML